MATSRIRLDLVPDDSVDGDSRRWVLRVDGTDVGELGAKLDGDVHISMRIDAGVLDLGVARSALGRLLGAAPWGSDVRYVLPLDAVEPETARRAGFRLGESNGVGRWEREAPRARTGAQDITRFLDREGRIDRYPQQASERRRLLEWVAERALPSERPLSETEVNELVAPFAPDGDVAVLRRYLVDHGLVERTRSGSEYARTAH